MAAPVERIYVPARYAAVETAVANYDAATAGGGPAQLLVVGAISGTVVLTRVDGTEVTIPATVQTALGGRLELQFTAFRSAAGADFLVGW
ncbi:MAG: hypothetical protein WC683_06395 [bacterium]